jgi:hypothetical protein
MTRTRLHVREAVRVHGGAARAAQYAAHASAAHRVLYSTAGAAHTHRSAGDARHGLARISCISCLTRAYPARISCLMSRTHAGTAGHMRVSRAALNPTAARPSLSL